MTSRIQSQSKPIYGEIVDSMAHKGIPIPEKLGAMKFMQVSMNFLNNTVSSSLGPVVMTL
jgi:uncharacterized membrane protein YbaN (DUF454 family)